MGQFALALQAFHLKTAEKADRWVLLCLLEVRSRLIVRSPVDKGRFRGAWVYGLEVRPQGESGIVDPNGAATLARLAGQITMHPAGKVHWLLNNVPYAVILERGGSAQAPNGVVGITALEWPSIVANARIAA